jgi:hypothetical protein
MIITAGVDGGCMSRIEISTGCRSPALLGKMPEYTDKHRACRCQYQNPDEDRKHIGTQLKRPGFNILWLIHFEQHNNFFLYLW